MKTNKTILLAIFSAVLLFACSKEQLTGPQGPQGPQGQQGPQGPAGTSVNLGYLDVTPSINQFVLQSDWIYQYQTTTAQFPPINLNNTTVVGFMLNTVTSSTPQFIALPYNDYWNTGTTYVKHYFAVAGNGRLWLYMRRNDGGVPYGNQTSNVQLGYRFFILKKSQLPDNLDLDSYDEVEKFAIQNPDAVEEMSFHELR